MLQFNKKQFVLITLTLALGLGLAGCEKAPEADADQNSNINVSQIQNLNQDINLNANVNQNTDGNQVWSVTYINGNKKVNNNYLGISFEYPDPNDDIKFRNVVSQYFALYKNDYNNKDYLLTFHIHYFNDYNNEYNSENFENFVKTYQIIPSCPRGTGAEMISMESYETMIKKAKIVYQKIISEKGITLYIIRMDGIDCSGKKNNMKQLLIYYPDSLNQNINTKHNIFYLNFFIDDKKNPEVYNQILSTFEFIKD